MEDKARYVAVKTLYNIEVDGSFSNIKLNENFKKYNLESLDRAFASEILYGTIRWKLKIDYLIQKFSKQKISKLSPWVLCCIRTAIYQIYFMDRVPDFAAVNQAVEITKKEERKASSFVNGVLRNILRKKDEFNNIDVKDEIEKISIEYSHPAWFVKMMVNEHGIDFTLDLMKKNNTPSEFTIRVNTLKCSKDELKSLLYKKGVESYDGLLDESMILKGYSMIERSDEFKNGLFTIQDESSMLCVKILDPKPGQKILDMCSAPGGKATYMAELMGNNGEITAIDIYEHKIDLIRKNSKRLGIDVIKTKLMDSSIYFKELEEYADRVLVDAPCSGLGLMRKKPEIRWNTGYDDIIKLNKIQYSILNNASKYVKKGGSLVYSTCTITREENEDIVEKFILENKNFSMEDISKYIPKIIKSDTCKNGFIKLFPNLYGTDGFFIAKLIRNW